MCKPALKGLGNCAAQRNRFEGVTPVSVGTYWIKCAPGSVSYCAGKYRYVYVSGRIPDKKVEACLSTYIDQLKADRVVYRIEANECICELSGILSCCVPKRNLVAFDNFAQTVQNAFLNAVS